MSQSPSRPMFTSRSSGSRRTTCSFGETLSCCSESTLEPRVPIQIQDWPMSQPEKQRMLVRALDAELQMATMEFGEEQVMSFELQDRCDRQRKEIHELKSKIRSQAHELDEQRRTLLSQEAGLDRQRGQIVDLQSHVDQQTATMDAWSAKATAQIANGVNAADIPALIANSERAEHASRDEEQFPEFTVSQCLGLEEKLAAREEHFAESRTRLQEQERFILAQNDRLQAQACELVDARRKNRQLSKQLSSVQTSLQLQEDHAIMIKRDAKEIQPRLVELRAAQHELDLQKTQLSERETRMQRMENVLEEGREELERRRERVQRAEITATRVLAEVEGLKQRFEQIGGSAAVATRWRGADHLSHPSSSEALRDRTCVAPNAAEMCARPRFVRVGA
eukprot:TRINITY_DN10850_c0_g1_i4.p1 TRINITY_DN10850_c0_g1~~TRINITY_DN10850_c0_g1_i4.p1  ORF type:complete len:394 (+),score=62.68 TRINITY_DN10850_c0_g1_i4:155-1336(+)